jgi:phage terminase large subunit-like protein
MYENGVIYHKHTDREYEHELLAFPRGKHDDRADAMAMAVTEGIQNSRSGAKQFKQKIAGYFKKKY